MRFGVLFFIFLTSCAYHLGDSKRNLPGGYNRVAIPMFSNKTELVGLEPYFTNSLIREFERSKVAQVTSSATAPITVEGIVEKVEVLPQAQVKASESKSIALPDSTVLTTTYRVLVTTRLKLRRNSDNKIVWEQEVASESVYLAPIIGPLYVNSANATYNQSARDRSIAELAQEMMQEAHDRMTESF